VRFEDRGGRGKFISVLVGRRGRCRGREEVCCSGRKLTFSLSLAHLAESWCIFVFLPPWRMLSLSSLSKSELAVFADEAKISK
jgi:hypothetical protein